jgi:hypothetical protein
MTLEELKRANIGQGLIFRKRIIEMELESLKLCNGVNIFKTRLSINPSQTYLSCDNEDEVMFNFVKGNPFYSECEKLIDNYRLFLENELDEIKTKFDNL